MNPYSDAPSIISDVMPQNPLFTLFEPGPPVITQMFKAFHLVSLLANSWEANLVAVLRK